MGREDGQSMVEFAFIVPFLLFILIAIVQVGFFLQAKATLRDGVRAAARQAALCRATTGSSPTPTSVYHGIVDSSLASAPNPTISPNISVACTSTPAGTQVTVTGGYNYDVNVFGIITISHTYLDSKAVAIVE